LRKKFDKDAEGSLAAPPDRDLGKLGEILESTANTDAVLGKDDEDSKGT
jgi:hypothetical protein